MPIINYAVETKLDFKFFYLEKQIERAVYSAILAYRKTA